LLVVSFIVKMIQFAVKPQTKSIQCSNECVQTIDSVNLLLLVTIGL